MIKELLNDKLQWIKEKGYWVLVVLVISATLFIAALVLTASLSFFIQPLPYKAEAFPQFQTLPHNGYKLVAVLQNSYLKSEFCSLEGFTNTGRSINQQQFCNFNYQTLPTMNKEYDVTIYGLNSVQIRYATVCLLKLPRKTQILVSNTSQEASNFNIRNRYVCQKYRAYSKLHIVNNMDADQLIFLEVELELTEKGFESLEFLQVRLDFEEERSRPMKLFIDNYFWIAGFLTLGVAVWTGLVTFVLGLGLIVRAVLVQKQEEQQRRLSKLSQKKND